ncbi:ABC transporter permease [Paenibacillus sp. GCM10023248]|uniref:ABC transporter permease n=2 Tax=Bacillales TaxID=1385 RepID=UPI0023792846|nr:MULTISPECIES: ABC transporter permease subunit [Bacillales]MDD9268312.1 ABC transporter permease subunit [Paenibacillus sp. MAHUQ-63]MDR6879992.1 putative aldouronate transport system permease protein [Bacillus sp. 3255]
MAAQNEWQLTGLTQSAPKSRFKRVMYSLRRDKFLYALIAPGVLFFLIFKYVPMWGIIIAFQDYSPYMGVMGSEWVGLEHFIRFFSNPDFYLLFRNTLAISVLNLVFFFPLPILLSLLLNELRNAVYKKWIQSIVYMPHFLSWVIIAGITFLLLSQSSGILNKMLVELGFPKYDFLTNENNFWALLTIQNIWKETGWGTIIFLAAIAGVDPQLYEAAKMDGANRLRQAWHVTLPAIRSVIVVLFILRLGHIMDVGFEQVFLMMNGAVSNVADVFETYVYRIGIQQGQFSFSTAVGLFKSVIGFLLVIAANKLAKRFGEEGVY